MVTSLLGASTAIGRAIWCFQRDWLGVSFVEFITMCEETARLLNFVGWANRSLALSEQMTYELRRARASMVARVDGVVPFGVEGFAFELDGGELRVGDLDALG